MLIFHYPSNYHFFLHLLHRFFSFKPHHDNIIPERVGKTRSLENPVQNRFHCFIRCFYRQFIQTIRLLVTKNKMQLRLTLNLAK